VVWRSFVKVNMVDLRIHAASCMMAARAAMEIAETKCLMRWCVAIDGTVVGERFRRWAVANRGGCIGQRSSRCAKLGRRRPQDSECEVQHQCAIGPDDRDEEEMCESGLVATTMEWINGIDGGPVRG